MHQQIGAAQRTQQLAHSLVRLSPCGSLAPKLSSVLVQLQSQGVAETVDGVVGDAKHQLGHGHVHGVVREVARQRCLGFLNVIGKSFAQGIINITDGLC